MKEQKEFKLTDLDIDVFELKLKINRMSVKKGYKIFSMVVPNSKDIVLYLHKIKEVEP